MQRLLEPPPALHPSPPCCHAGKPPRRCRVSPGTPFPGGWGWIKGREMPQTTLPLPHYAAWQWRRSARRATHAPATRRLPRPCKRDKVNETTSTCGNAYFLAIRRRPPRVPPPPCPPPPRPAQHALPKLISCWAPCCAAAAARGASPLFERISVIKEQLGDHNHHHAPPHPRCKTQRFGTSCCTAWWSAEVWRAWRPRSLGRRHSFIMRAVRARGYRAIIPVFAWVLSALCSNFWRVIAHTIDIDKGALL